MKFASCMSQSMLLRNNNNMNRTSHLIYDIEVAPLPLEQLEELMPEFSAPANYTKPEAIKKAIDEKRADWIDKAALSAISGTILCVGISEDFNAGIIDGDEVSILKEFWSHCSEMKEQNAGAVSFVGYNSHSYDLPMLCRRSWILGVQVPSWIRNGRYFHSSFQDLREIWQLGDRQESTGGLSGLSRAFGLGDKLGSGKHFGKLWAEDREAAIAYVMKDIQITEQLALRMGVIQPRSNDAIIIKQPESDDFDY